MIGTWTPATFAGLRTLRASVRHALAEQAGDDSATGELLLDGRTGATADGSGVRLWAGRIKALVLHRSRPAVEGRRRRRRGHRGRPLAVDPREAQNSFTGTTVDAIVLEVSHRHPRLRPGARIGVWAATRLATDAGGWRQINRAGHPMMWPIFWPSGRPCRGGARVKERRDRAGHDENSRR